MMGGGPRLVKNTKGLLFFKLLGTGKKGFSVLPDWSEYAFLAVWESEDDAGLFF